MSERFFEAIAAGRLPPPECAKTLGVEIIGYDLAAQAGCDRHGNGDVPEDTVMSGSARDK